MKRYFLFIILLLQSLNVKPQIKENLISKDSLDKIFTNVIDKNGPPAGILILGKGKKVLYKAGFGLADIENNRNADSKTQFNIASISKSFTALAIMQLVEKGKLSVQDPVGKFFPGFPKGDKITIHQLLTHTSGISDSANISHWLEKAGLIELPDSSKEENNYRDFLLTSAEGFLNTDGILQLLKTRPVFSFEPGTESKWKYSNRGYNVLAKIIEKVSGQHFENYMRENIFLPLGMKNTFVHTGVNQDDLGITNFAACYIPSDTGWRKIYNLVPGGAGDGNVYTTLDDWLNFEQCLIGNMPHVISKNSLNEIFTKQVKSLYPTPDSYYGYGWFIIENEADGKVIQHTGGNISISCIRNDMQKENLTIIIFSTTTPYTSIIQNFWQYLFRNKLVYN